MRLAETPAKVDFPAVSFREKIKGTNAWKLTSLDEAIEPEVARRDIKSLDGALELWGANPADGLPSDTGLEFEFDRLRRQAQGKLKFFVKAF